MAQLPLDPDTGDAIGRGREWDIAPVVAAGGAIGGASCYLLNQDMGGGPWATFTENVLGSFLLGALMVVVLARPSRYIRPFLGVGVLGGFTTFSAYIIDTHELISDGRTPLALLYLFGSVVAGLLACAAGMILVRRLL